MRYLLIILLLFPSVAFGADHYVLQGGSGDGSAWNNAWDDLPATLTRGDTYYIGDGVYAGYNFNDTVSSTTLIYIKKATESAHGTETGWSSEYGNGVAEWSSWQFSTSYYELDGITGGGPTAWDSGFGFSVHRPEGPAKIIKFEVNGTSNITVKHTDLYYDTNSTTSTNGGIIYAHIGATDNVTFSHCYIHQVFGPVVHFGYGDGWVFEYNKMGDNTGTSGVHSEIFSCLGNDTAILRYNYFFKWRSTGGIIGINGAEGQFGDNNMMDGWEVYGNIFEQDGTTASWVIGVIDDSSNQQFARGWKIYNNTFIDLNSTSTWIYAPSLSTYGGSVNYLYNNIYYGNTDGVIIGGVTNDYNSYQGSGSYMDGGNDALLESDPFTNYSTGDYTLSSAMAGSSLSGYVATDMLGFTRGGDGTWDRGAFEYGSGAATPPANVSSQAATGGTQVVGLTWTNPADADYTGVTIRYRTDGTFPDGWSNGTLFEDNLGSASATDSSTMTNLEDSTTYSIGMYAYDASGSHATGATVSATTNAAAAAGTTLRTVFKGGSFTGGSMK